jgi:putative salt-induced outer membrane protein YdiY
MRRVAACCLVSLAGVAFGDEVELSTGEKLKGTIVSRDAEKIVLDHPVLGRLTIPAAQIKPEAPPPEPDDWKFKAELGATGSSGNVDQSALHAAVSAVLDNDARRLKAEVGHSSAETEDVKTQDKTFAEATHDWKFKGSPWSLFVTGRMDWDEFQDWDRRATLGVGAGYALSDTDELKARLRLGFAETREWGASDDDNNRWRPEALLGAEASWKLNETNSIDGKVTYYRDLRETSEWRAIGALSWSVKLAKESPLSLKFGVEDEYDTHRDAPFEKNDFRYFAALVAEF